MAPIPNNTYAALNVYAPIYSWRWWPALTAILSAQYNMCFTDGWCYGWNSTLYNSTETSSLGIP